ncbi:MAG: S8 family serine peptidase [Planctomycetia bacterium]|nr:S8 family serine peptidase [Planctomycetia bacterium]
MKKLSLALCFSAVVIGVGLLVAGRALLAAERRPARPAVPVEDPRAGELAKGPIVAVLDTGVDEKHPALKGRCLPGINVAEADQPCEDRAGHGTAVAGLIASADDDPELRGTCPTARILPVKVTPGDSRETLPAFLALGIEKALDAKAHVICIAMGASRSSRALDEALERAKKEGVLVVAAAGVGSGAMDLWPAMHPWAVSCAVSEPQLTRLPGAATDTMVEYPASRAHISGKTEVIGSGFAKSLAPGGGYGQLEGSSVVCARTAGIAALVCARFPAATAEERRRVLALCGAPMEAVNIVHTYPARRLSVAAAGAVPVASEGTDLALVRVDVNPGPLEAGRLGALEFHLVNIGFAPAAGQVSFEATEPKVSVTAKFEAIPPGESRVVTLELPVLQKGFIPGVGKVTGAKDANPANDACNVRLEVREPKDGPSIVCYRPRLTRLRMDDRKAVVEFEVQNAKNMAFTGEAAVELGKTLSRTPIQFDGRGTKVVSVEIEVPTQEEGKRGFEMGVGVLQGDATLDSDDLILLFDDGPERVQYADAWATKEIIMDAPAFILEGRATIPVLLFAPEVHTMIDSVLESRAGRISKGDRAFGLWLYHITLEEVSPETALATEFNPWAEPPATLGGRVLLNLEARKDVPEKLAGKTVVAHKDIAAESAVGMPMLGLEDLLRFVEEDGWSSVINVPLAALKSTSEPYVYLRGAVRYLDRARNPSDARFQKFEGGAFAYQTMLRVRLHAFLPKLEASGQHYDVHVHTQCEFSRDAVEPRLAWGGPLWMLIRTAYAMGFVDEEYVNAVRSGNLAAVAARELLFTTDHNCFLLDDDTPFALPFRSGEAEITTLRRFVGKGANQELSMAPPGGRELGSPHALTYGHEPIRGPWHGGRGWNQYLLVARVVKEVLDSLEIPEALSKSLPVLAKYLVDHPGAQKSVLEKINGALKKGALTEAQFATLARTLAQFTEEGLNDLFAQAERIMESGLKREETNENDVPRTEAKLAAHGVYIAAHPMTCKELSWDLGDLDRAANLVGGPFVEVEQAGRFPFVGIQAWNEPATRKASLGHPDQLRQFNPWKLQAMKGDLTWHQEWATGFLHYENRLVKPGLMFTFSPKDQRRKYFIRKLYHYAGSDAHGSFNFTTGVGATLLTHTKLMPLFAAFGQAHGTSTHSSHYGAARVYAARPSFEEVYRGRVVCTDGPLVWFDVDSDVKFDAKELVWHESWEAPNLAQDVDGEIGGDGVFDGKRTMLIRRACDGAVVRYRVADGGPLAPVAQRVDLYRLLFSDEAAPREAESRGGVFVPRAQASWKPAPGQALQYRALKPWAPDGPGVLFLGGFSAWNEDSDDRYDIQAKRCFTNPVWFTTVDIGATAEPVVENGKAFVPKGKFIATFRADHSMLDAAPTVLLKQFKSLGDSVAATWRLVPVATSEGIWKADPREVNGAKVEVDDAVMIAVNEEAIPLSAPWFPVDGVDTFAVILSGAKDTHGNPLNPVANKIEIRAPEGTVTSPDPPAAGDGAAGGANPPADTATVSVRPGDEVQLPKGGTCDGKTIPPGAWTVPDLPERGLSLVVSSGGQTLTLLLTRSSAPREPFLDRTNSGFYGAAPVPGKGPATVTIKNHTQKTVEPADPVLVTGDTCVFSAPQAEPGACDVTVTQGQASKTTALEAVAPKIAWDQPDAQPGETRVLRVTLEGAKTPGDWRLSGTVEIANGQVMSVADPARIGLKGAVLTLDALPASVRDLAQVQALQAGKMTATAKLRAVKARK